MADRKYAVKSHYVVGIDLGTTHTVVAYASLGRAGNASATIRLLDLMLSLIHI